MGTSVSTHLAFMSLSYVTAGMLLLVGWPEFINPSVPITVLPSVETEAPEMS